jgi:HK97 family phage prohead protease
MDSKMIRKVLTAEVKELADGVLEFIGSAGSTDRDGEVIKAEGWELENYKKNPVILWAHRYDEPPIGKAVNVKVVGPNLVFQVKFADATIYPFADTIYKLCKGGFLNATSVGFIPKEWELGKKESDPARTFTKQELLELSIVPVPSNPDALRNALDAKLITIKEFDAITNLKKAVSQAELKDELDFVLTLLKENTLDPENTVLVKSLKSEIERLTGSDIPVKDIAKEEDNKEFKEYLNKVINKIGGL